MTTTTTTATIKVILSVLLVVALFASSKVHTRSSSSPKQHQQQNSVVGHGAHGTENFLYFWHLTDPHLDLQYLPGTVANCDDLPICCRSNSSNSDPNQPKKLAGIYGPGQLGSSCDIPLKTWEETVQFIKGYFGDDVQKQNELFVFYGGDNLAHDDWEYTRSLNLKLMKLVHESMLNILRPSSTASTTTPVKAANNVNKKVNERHNSLLLSAIGNHDGYPVDQFDFHPANSWFLDPFTDLMMEKSGINDQGALETMRHSGYYTVKVREGLRAIILNTQWQDPFNFHLYKDRTGDPANQLSFLSKVLSNARANSERAIILGHIPPGMKDHSATPSSISSYNLKFQQIVDEFSDVIIVQSYGHTHKDSFHVVMDYATNTVPKSIVLTTPSVSTWTTQNPAVRLFKLDKKYPYDLVDVVTFYSNVTRANKDGKMSFEVEYSTKQAYNMPDLSPKSWYQLANQFLTNDTLWSRFSEHYYAKFTKLSCQGKCRLAHYCSTVYTQVKDYNNCILQP